MEQFTIENLYSLKETIAASLFEGAVYPWELLPKISGFIVELGKEGQGSHVAQAELERAW